MTVNIEFESEMFCHAFICQLRSLFTFDISFSKINLEKTIGLGELELIHSISICKNQSTYVFVHRVEALSVDKSWSKNGHSQLTILFCIPKEE